jgi:phage-related protein (TIGR01555 family)
VSRWELTPSQLVWDLNSPFYGEPEFYRRNMADRGQVNSSQAQQVEIHPSRVIRFIGNEYPDIMTATDPAWGDPILQAINDAVLAAGLVVGSYTALIQDMQVDVIQIPNMTGIVATQAGRERLTKRLSYANQAKSVTNALLMDKEETWSRMSSPAVATAPGVIQQYFALAAGAADIPATRMLGQSPAGLNATGDSDIRNYYDKIKAAQENELRPSLERLDQVLIRSALGSYDENISYDWAPLWQLSGLEQTQMALAQAQAFQIDVSSGVIPEPVLAEARKSQLIQSGFYPGLDDAYEKYEAGLLEEPEPSMAEQMAGAFGGQQMGGPGQQQQLPPGQQPEQKALPPPGPKDSSWWQEMRDRFDVEELLHEDDVDA